MNEETMPLEEFPDRSINNHQAKLALAFVFLLCFGLLMWRQASVWKDAYRRTVVFLIIKEAGVDPNDKAQVDQIKAVVAQSRPYVSEKNNLIIGISRKPDGTWILDK